MWTTLLIIAFAPAYTLTHVSPWYAGVRTCIMGEYYVELFTILVGVKALKMSVLVLAVSFPRKNLPLTAYRVFFIAACAIRGNTAVLMCISRRQNVGSTLTGRVKYLINALVTTPHIKWGHIVIALIFVNFCWQNSSSAFCYQSKFQNY